MNVWLSLLIMFLVIYSVRMIPMILLRRNITNPTVRSFLYYVPYVTLSLMTFPAIIDATDSALAGLLSLILGSIAAYKEMGLFKVTVICCATVLILEIFI